MWGARFAAQDFRHDGSTPDGGKKIGYGVCFVVIGLAVRLPGISHKVFCLPYAARLWWPKNSRIEPQGLPYKIKPELAWELIRFTRSWVSGDIIRRVVGYSNGALVKNRPANAHITGKVRKDAVLYEPVVPHSGSTRRGRPRKKGTEIPKPTQMFTYKLIGWEAIFIELYGKETILLVHQFHAIWYRVGGNEVLSIVLVRDPDGDYPDTVLFDTDIKTTDEQTVNRFPTAGASK